MDTPNPAIAAFMDEARELLDGLEGQLLGLEQDRHPEAVDAIFRTLHTIKGSGAMFGFASLSRFTHHFEEAFSQVRDGKLPVSQGLLDLAFAARDQMLGLLHAAEPDAPLAGGSTELLAQLAALCAEGGAAPAAGRPGPTRHYRISLRPGREAFRHGMRPDLLIAELGTLGALRQRVDSSGVPPLDRLVPEECHLVWQLDLTTAQSRQSVDAVFLFQSPGEAVIEEIVPPQDEPPPTARARPDMRQDSVRVPANKLDGFMDQLGELVIAQARLQKTAGQHVDAELETVVEEMDRLVTGLRDATLSIRMLPLETVFGKFRRVVRDLSAELGKQVDLVTEGGETEIDKTVIDRLSEPLVHMIRNSIDHGIEPAGKRRALGKPERGTILLEARQEGGEIVITLADDGGGLDLAAIRAKAVDRGLIAADATPSDMELQQFIFAPGFSTAAQLTSVSGRGVGMDAVRTVIEGLRGRVEAVSYPGLGTEVTLCLPVALAIIDGLLVRLGETTFVIPLSAIDECIEFDPPPAQAGSGLALLQIRDQLVPFVDLDHVFGRPTGGVTRRRVVSVRAEQYRLGLIVDDILGRNQIVIKPFSIYHRDIEGFSGATILGDGSVALILDVVSIMRRAQAMQREMRPAA